MPRARIFISYKRNVEPDESVANLLHEAFAGRCEVFIDVRMSVGTRWAEYIESAIKNADYFIALLSNDAVQSEMVVGEIELAYFEARRGNRRPAILPVRLRYNEAFQYPLNAYLNHINWASWDGPQDTPRLLDELLLAVNGEKSLPKADDEARPALSRAVTDDERPLPTAQPTSLELPGGTMSPDSRFYIERRGDIEALSTISRRGTTIVIKGPRQLGKSSLLMRTVDAAQKLGKRHAFLDFQIFDSSQMASADLFYRQFCSWLSYTLEISDETADYWSLPLGNTQRCTRYMERHVLKELGGSLVLAMDEVDRIFNLDFSSDFFGMLRSWHNSRATSSVWKLLDMMLVTSTEPYRFIKGLNQSPFNVGVVIELDDFKPEQVDELNRRHGSPLDPDGVDKLIGLLNGHPYLTRRALYAISGGTMSLDELVARADEDDGPFGDHLRYYLLRLHGLDDLIGGLIQCMEEGRINNETIFFRLRGAGLVRREGQQVVPRCELYKRYFKKHLDVQTQPHR